MKKNLEMALMEMPAYSELTYLWKGRELFLYGDNCSGKIRLTKDGYHVILYRNHKRIGPVPDRFIDPREALLYTENRLKVKRKH